MYDLSLTHEQIEFRDTVADFTRSKIRPTAIHPNHLEPFAKPLQVDLLDEASALGIRTILISNAANGIGADLLTACLVFEELSTGDVDIAVTLAHTAAAGKLLFDHLLTEEQKAKYLSAFIENDQFHLSFIREKGLERDGWSYHKPQSSVGSNQLTIKEIDNGWLLNGHLQDVSNADVAKLIVVQTLDYGIFLIPPDISGFDLDSSSDPFARTTNLGDGAVSWTHGAVSDCLFHDCKLGIDHRIEIGSSEERKIQEFQQGSLALQAAIQIGLAKIAMETAVDYAKLRYQGGRNIVEHQAIGSKIADMAIKLESARNVIWKAAWVTDHPEAVADRSLPNIPYSIMAQSLAAESANETINLAAELFGAMGVMRDMPLQKYVNDSFIFLNSNGYDSATKLRVAEAVVDFRTE